MDSYEFGHAKIIAKTDEGMADLLEKLDIYYKLKESGNIAAASRQLMYSWIDDNGVKHTEPLER